MTSAKAPARRLLTTAIVLALTPAVHAGRVLFDATKAEMASNADWVIDSDGEVGGDSNPARFPTPAQSGITASTSESYWKGGISAWGVAMVKHGNTVESLPRTGAITYGSMTNPQDLSHYKTYVVCEPNALFTLAEKTALVNFVKDGGGLFIVSDHNGSDRNGDGVDSPKAWNDFFTNNGVANNPFGMAVNLNSLSQVSTNLSPTAPFKTGTSGTAANLEYNSGATFTISTTANSSVTAAVWTNGSQTNSNVMMAYASYGLGRVVALGDSSPADDGTGDTGDSLFTGWSTGTNGVLIANATDWLGNTPQTSYDSATGGSWANAAAWTGVVPDSATTIVDFENSLTADATVTLDHARSAATLRFDSTHSYTVAGTATLTFGSTPTVAIMPGIIVTRGSHTITAPLVMPGRGEINVQPATSTLTTDKLTSLTGGGLIKSGLGRWQMNQIDGSAFLDVEAGSIGFVGSSATQASRVANLFIDTDATVDLGNGALVVDYVDGNSPLTTIKSYLVTGLLSTSKAGLTVGYAEASALGVTSFAGQTVDGSSLLLRSTLRGDANLDLAVNFDDLTRLAQHYNLAGTWSDGDFDGSGTVDFGDLVSLVQNYNGSANGIDGVSGSFASDWMLARSLVPEPATAAVFSLALVALRRTRCHG